MKEATLAVVTCKTPLKGVRKWLKAHLSLQMRELEEEHKEQKRHLKEDMKEDMNENVNENLNQN